MAVGNHSKQARVRLIAQSPHLPRLCLTGLVVTWCDPTFLFPPDLTCCGFNRRCDLALDTPPTSNRNITTTNSQVVKPTTTVPTTLHKESNHS